MDLSKIYSGDNMKKDKIIIFLLITITLIFSIFAIYSYFSKKENTTLINNNSYKNNPFQPTKLNSSSTVSSLFTKELCTFTTPILSRDNARQNNVEITCNNLNGNVMKNNENFSFCSVVGKATYEKGYLEADIFDKEGNKIKGLGGGICQVSTTLYNAVLNSNCCEIIERHPHSRYVPYAAEGLDASVAYGSIDLIIKNTSGKDILINASCTEADVTITLFTYE